MASNVPETPHMYELTSKPFGSLVLSCNEKADESETPKLDFILELFVAWWTHGLDSRFLETHTGFVI